MKKLLLSSLLLLTSISVFAQPVGPESMEYDPTTQKWFIADNGGNQVLTRAANGTYSLFVTGFTSGPHGLEVVGDQLFVCDGNALKVYDIPSQTLLHSTTLGSGLFLNGITHDNNGNIFVTAFSGYKIFRYVIATQTFYTYVSSLSFSPNGIVFDEDDNRLIFVEWANSNARIQAVNPADSTVSTLATTTVGNIDGITKNCQEQFYISSWSPNRITRFENDFVAAGVNMNATGISSPADIFFAQETDSLGVPNASNVKFFHYPSCLNVSVEESAEELPLFDVLNWGAGGMAVRLAGSVLSGTSIEVFDISGKCIRQVQPTSNVTSFQLDNGVYFFKVVNEGRSQTIKSIVLR